MAKEDCKKIIHEYFHYPYDGSMFVYNNIVKQEDAVSQSFTQILSHSRSIDRISISMSIHEAVVRFAGGVEGKNVLDVGSRQGHFSFLMAEAGAKVTGIDDTEREITFSNCMAKIKGLNACFTCDTIHHFLKSDSCGYDLALVLNVFDHVLRDTPREEAFWVLGEISRRCNKMVYMSGPLIPELSNVGIPEMVIGNSQYKNHESLLEKSYAGRTLHGFW